MKQCDIYDIYLDPVLGSEQHGRRPAIILSGTEINKLTGTVIVVPLTTSVKFFKDNLILRPNDKNGLTKVSEAMTIHIRSIDKKRLKTKLGSITEKELKIVKGSLDKVLKY